MDVVVCRLLAALGRTLADVPYIQMAEKAGAGTADYQRLKPVML